jgi:hypothetical protein
MRGGGVTARGWTAASGRGLIADVEHDDGSQVLVWLR